MRRRLLLAMVGVATLAVAAFAFPLAWSDRSRIRQAAESELRRDTERIARLVPANLRSPSWSLPPFTDDPGLLASVYDVNGRRVAGRGPDEADTLVRRALRGATDCADVGTARVCVESILEGGDIVGVARASEPKSTIENRIRDRMLALTARALAVLMVAAVAAVLGARRLSRPITELHDAAMKLGAGEFTVDVPPSGIAEMDQTADALRAAAERLRSVIDRERAFSADVSHQLRTPITSLRASLETEMLAPRPDPGLLIGEALKDVDRLESTVSHLLALTRDAPTDRQILVIADILRELEASFASSFAGERRTLRIEPVPEHLPPVRASRSAVEQILHVLVANAREHGAGTVTVSVIALPPSGLAFRVTDEGRGVKGDPQTIFRRRAGSAHGHGIGLALASTLARAEGGHLSLEASGPRPTFRLTLAGVPTDHAAARADRSG